MVDVPRCPEQTARHGLFLSSVLALVTATGCRHPVTSHPVAEPVCNALGQIPANSAGRLRVSGCRPFDPSNWRKRRRPEPDECRIAGYVVKDPEPESAEFDHAIVISDPSNPATTPMRLLPEPRVHRSIAGAGAEVAFSCDDAGRRIFYASEYLPLVVSYDTLGRELWRATLPNYLAIADSLPVNVTVRQAMELFDREGSITTNLVASGEYLAVEYRTRNQYYQSVYHRSGRFIDTIGPWDGTLEHEPIEGGWRVMAGGVAAYGNAHLPNESLDLRVVDTTWENLTRHFLEWFEPRVDDPKYVWRRCEGDNLVVPLALGKAFRKELDAIARDAHDGLGPSWFATIASSPPVAGVLAGYRQGVGEEWRSQLRAALLAAGADVALARYVNEHHIDLPGPRSLSLGPGPQSQRGATTPATRPTPAAAPPGSRGGSRQEAP